MRIKISNLTLTTCCKKAIFYCKKKKKLYKQVLDLATTKVSFPPFSSLPLSRQGRKRQEMPSMIHNAVIPFSGISLESLVPSSGIGSSRTEVIQRTEEKVEDELVQVESLGEEGPYSLLKVAENLAQSSTEAEQLRSGEFPIRRVSLN